MARSLDTDDAATLAPDTNDAAALALATVAAYVRRKLDAEKFPHSPGQCRGARSDDQLVPPPARPVRTAPPASGAPRRQPQGAACSR